MLRENPKQVFIVMGLISKFTYLSNWDFDIEHNFIKSKQELLEKWLSPNDISNKVIPLSTLFMSHQHLDFNIWQNANQIFELVPSSAFEPYYGLHDCPLFDEVMVGCGHDKIVNYEELILAGYKTWVIPDMFIVHLDSVGWDLPGAVALIQGGTKRESRAGMVK